MASLIDDWVLTGIQYCLHRIDSERWGLDCCEILRGLQQIVLFLAFLLIRAESLGLPSDGSEDNSYNAIGIQTK